jgi:hypothetical protein
MENGREGSSSDHATLALFLSPRERLGHFILSHDELMDLGCQVLEVVLARDLQPPALVPRQVKNLGSSGKLGAKKVIVTGEATYRRNVPRAIS